MTQPPLLELRDIACRRDDQLVFSNVNLTIHEGDIVVLRGRSGCGKTTLLRCIAHLILYEGQVLYRGSTPKAYGIPSFRTRMLYVPQRPSMLPGTPQDFLRMITSLDAHKAHVNALKKDHNYYQDPLERALEISAKWDVDSSLWEREWANLSGGETQRIALAIAVGLNTAEVMLLDEPTSALDSESSSAVERYMLNEIRSPDSALKAMVWITHSDEQGSRVGTKFIQISSGGCFEEPTPLV
ncbi:putative ABC transporter [Lyophyllum shimeji]|uniref:ABC transporter n=1 Tax=Lyophyllum shimeji TaxID=47721 RepID=A0A9P3PG13_LYOSH|nr:putative ABC transporter [Lyophyllum shimeji]